MALLGASGSGKSTLLNLLAGLTDVDAGEIQLNGNRVMGPSDVLVPGHDSIRLVHQEYQLMPNVSIRENIAYALRFFQKDYRDYRVDELLKLCRLTHVRDRLPRYVSGGEKQRAAIARAIADKPAVLLLDEPFSHLDLPNRMMVRDLLFELVRQEDNDSSTACLLVTHDAADALSIADTLGILQDGKLIQYGSPTDVYQYPLTTYAAQMTGPVTILKTKYLSTLNLDNPDLNHSKAFVCIRPEQVHLANAGVPAVVKAVYFKGSHYEIDVNVSRYVSVRLLTTHSDLQVGQSVNIQLQEKAVWYLNA